MAIASLILGILSLLFISPLFALIGLILGLKSNKKLKEQNEPAGLAIGGIVTNSIGLIISSFLLLIMVAVAVPKFTVAVDKARASEAPSLLSQIASAEAVYEAETGSYFQPANRQEITDSLGVTIVKSAYFEYSIEVINDSFTSKATLIQKLGGASVGDYLWIDQDGNRGVEGDELAKLVPIWSGVSSYNSYY